MDRLCTRAMIACDIMANDILGLAIPSLKYGSLHSGVISIVYLKLFYLCLSAKSLIILLCIV